MDRSTKAAMPILAVEMEAAGFYTFTKARRKKLPCLAQAENQMGWIAMGVSK
jgi:hypothetical protein